MNILGIEASCDDTAAAIVNSTGKIISNIVYDQMDLHAAYGGIVPEIAARAHTLRLRPVVEEALKTADMSLDDIGLVAVTSGPGLMGGLLSGVSFARGLVAGHAKSVKLVGVNHLLGHALTPRLTHNMTYPYLMLLISGGHCLFLSVEGPAACHRLGATLDDAPGEVFDKIAKYLGMGNPGGPLIQQHAQSGNPAAYKFPRPLAQRPDANMSFSGLKTAVRQAIDALPERTPQHIANICASFQAAVADILAQKALVALKMFRQRHTADTGRISFAVAGGVAANTGVRAKLDQLAIECDVDLVLPPVSLCTDNAAMIAWAGYEYAPFFIPQDLTARPRWPLDQLSDPLVGYGKKGAKS